MKSPLSGIRVLVIESFGAAPYGSMFLADLGAEVIKIEDFTTGGDASRAVGPYFFELSGDSHYFQTFNRNKKSVGLNIRTPEGKKIFRRIAQQCDAVLNNLRGDLPSRLGVDYESLKAINPKIVCAHISAFGRDNERTARPGYDYLMQAEAGFMMLTGEPDGPPVRMGLSVVDFTTGLTAIVGLLSALIKAKKTGHGCDVDTCLFDVALHQTSYLATWYLNAGAKAERMSRSAHPTVAPTQLFRTADGWIMVMCMKEKFWTHLTEKLDRSDLARDPDYSSASVRREHISKLTEILDAEFMKNSTEHWVELLATHLPVAPVYDLEQALESPFVERIGMIESVPHPQMKSFRTLSNPLKFDHARPHGRVCSKLGEDTNEVLRIAGFSEAEVISFHKKQIIKS